MKGPTDCRPAGNSYPVKTLQRDWHMMHSALKISTVRIFPFDSGNENHTGPGAVGNKTPTKDVIIQMIIAIINA